jgi:Na+(H+)/acetate symporter ActP
VALLLFAGVLSSKLSDRFSIPSLVLFLGIGILAGSEGIGRIYFDNAALAKTIGVIALSFILFSGGLETDFVEAKRVFAKGITLSTLGVLITAFVVGAISIFLAIKLQTLNVAFLVGLAFAVAASANLPAIVLSIYWKRFNTAGAVTGLAVGLLSSIILILISPSVMGLDANSLIQAEPWFPLKNPGIVSIPLGFIAAIVATLCTREPEAEAKFAELSVRANTGLGAEKASEH